MGNSFGMGMVWVKQVLWPIARANAIAGKHPRGNRRQPASEFQIMLIENRDSQAAPVLSNFMDLMIILLFGLS
jgi:hypothetical protein